MNEVKLSNGITVWTKRTRKDFEDTLRKGIQVVSWKLDKSQGEQR